MTRSEIARRIMDSSFLSGWFILRSGKTSSFYIDKYRFESDPGLIDAVTEEMIPLLPDAVDKLAGMELGGIPLATLLSHKTGMAARTSITSDAA